MNPRILINFGLIFSFLLGYMEWPGGNSAFVGQAMYEILFQKQNLAEVITHPVILSGLVGLLALLYAAFFQPWSRFFQVLGIVLLGAVIALILLAGALSLNIKSVVSTLPFMALTALYFYRFYRKN